LKARANADGRIATAVDRRRRAHLILAVEGKAQRQLVHFCAGEPAQIWVAAHPGPIAIRDASGWGAVHPPQIAAQA